MKRDDALAQVAQWERDAKDYDAAHAEHARVARKLTRHGFYDRAATEWCRANEAKDEAARCRFIAARWSDTVDFLEGRKKSA